MLVYGRNVARDLLKKGKNMQNDDNEFLSYEFPITIANIYINEDIEKIEKFNEEDTNNFKEKI